MEAVTRSWPSPEPICLRWEFPLWRQDESLDPNALKDGKPTRQFPEKLGKFQVQKQQILEELASGVKTKTRLKNMLNTNGTIIKDLVETLMEDGLIREIDIQTTGGKATGYELFTTTQT